MRSMGGRIVLSIVVALWALLIAASSYWYNTAKRMLQEEFDHGLRTEVGTLATLLDHKGAEVELDFADELLPHFRPGPRAAYFQIWRGDGTVVERSESMRHDDLPLRFGTTEGPELWDLELPNGRPGRACGTAFSILQDTALGLPQSERLAAAIPVRIVVAKDRQRLDNSLATIQLSIAVAGIGFALAAAVIVVLVIHRGLSPLRRLAQEVGRLDPQHLPQRLEDRPMPGELLPIAARLDDLVGRVHEVLERERRITSNIAHELMTPITELRVITDVALGWSDDPAYEAHALKEVGRIAEQMDVLASTVLSYSRAESGAMEPQLESFEIGSYLEDLVPVHRVRAEARGLGFAVKSAPECKVRTDPVLLRIVLSNLIGNAVDHSPDGGHVRCSIKAVETRVLITIANTCVGLDREDLPKLTERFWRKDSARSAGRPAHVGLGLSVVRELTVQLGLELEFGIDGDELTVVLGVPLDGG